MDIGKLNRRVDILHFVTHRDAFGGVVGEWETKCRAWARIEPVSGTEFFQSQQVTAEVVVKITLRYDPSINAMHRVSYLGKTFEIIGVTDDAAEHRATVLNCKELVNHELQREAKESQNVGGGGGCPCAGDQGDGGCGGEGDDAGC